MVSRILSNFIENKKKKKIVPPFEIESSSLNLFDTKSKKLLNKSKKKKKEKTFLAKMVET